MKILIDTNIFISLLENSKQSGISQSLLNVNEHDLGTSELNLLEVRTVLTKQKQHPQQSVEATIEYLREHLDFIVEQCPSLDSVEARQKESLLYPMDCMIYVTADENGAVPTTLEKEMRTHGCVHPKFLI
jgi:predicted nucleic-acid-binding protein